MTNETVFVYMGGALVTLFAMMGAHKSQLWKVNLVPEHTVEPGDDIMVPVGDVDNRRRMRVMHMTGPNTCLAIDVVDQQHRNGVAMATAAGWPIMLPIITIVLLLKAITSRQGVATMTQRPRPRPEKEQVPACISRETTWRN